MQHADSASACPRTPATSIQSTITGWTQPRITAETAANRVRPSMAASVRATMNLGTQRARRCRFGTIRRACAHQLPRPFREAPRP